MARKNTTRFLMKRLIEQTKNNIEKCQENVVEVGTTFEERVPEITALMKATFEGLEMCLQLLDQANESF